MDVEGAVGRVYRVDKPSEGIGSCVFISPSEVLTALHVLVGVERASQIQVRLRDGDKVAIGMSWALPVNKPPATMDNVPPELDFALIQLAVEFRDVPEISFMKSPLPERAETIFFGYRAEPKRPPLESVRAHLQRMVNGCYELSDAPVPGFSGGPVFTVEQESKLLGLVIRRTEQTRPKGWVIPIFEIVQGLRETSATIARLSKPPSDLPEADRLSGADNKALVFLIYPEDWESLASEVAHALEKRGIRVFFRPWSIRPGDVTREVEEQGLDGCTSVLVLVDSEGLRSWQDQYRWVALEGVVNAGKRVVPVLLPGADKSALPSLLRIREVVTLTSSRVSDADIDRLILGIGDSSEEAESSEETSSEETSSDEPPPLSSPPPIVLERGAVRLLAQAVSADLILTVWSPLCPQKYAPGSALSISLRLDGEAYHEATVAWCSPRWDLVLLRISGADFSYQGIVEESQGGGLVARSEAGEQSAQRFQLDPPSMSSPRREGLRVDFPSESSVEKLVGAQVMQGPNWVGMMTQPFGERTDMTEHSASSEEGCSIRYLWCPFTRLQRDLKWCELTQVSPPQEDLARIENIISRVQNLLEGKSKDSLRAEFVQQIQKADPTTQRDITPRGVAETLLGCTGTQLLKYLRLISSNLESDKAAMSTLMSIIQELLPWCLDLDDPVNRGVAQAKHQILHASNVTVVEAIVAGMEQRPMRLDMRNGVVFGRSAISDEGELGIDKEGTNLVNVIKEWIVKRSEGVTHDEVPFLLDDVVNEYQDHREEGRSHLVDAPYYFVCEESQVPANLGALAEELPSLYIVVYRAEEAAKGYHFSWKRAMSALMKKL